MKRPIYVIANEITKDWQNPYFGARPYLGAMHQLATVDDMYGLDSARSIILYFLAYAQTWHGETARRIKQELKQIVN